MFTCLILKDLDDCKTNDCRNYILKIPRKLSSTNSKDNAKNEQDAIR